MAKTMLVSLLVGLLFLAFAPEESHGMFRATVGGLKGVAEKTLVGGARSLPLRDMRCMRRVYNPEAFGVPKHSVEKSGLFSRAILMAQATQMEFPVISEPVKFNPTVFTFPAFPVCLPSGGSDILTEQIRSMILADSTRKALDDSITSSFKTAFGTSYEPPPDCDESEVFGEDVESDVKAARFSEYEGSKYDFTPEEIEEMAKTYSELSATKVKEYAQVDESAVELTHAGGASTPVKPGMYIEGTVKWRGCMCDIGVSSTAKTLGKSVLAAVNTFLGPNKKTPYTRAYVDEEITRAQMAVRMVFVNHAPEDMESTCSLPNMATARGTDAQVDLVEYMKERTGDCRMNNLLLGLLLDDLVAEGLISDVNYRNRKWGIKKTTDELEIGDEADRGDKTKETLFGNKNQGEHTLLSFKYGPEVDDTDSGVEHTLDAYARQHDRLPLSGDVPMDTARDWYSYPTVAAKGYGATSGLGEILEENNAWARLDQSGMLDLILPKMTAYSKSRFSDQTLVGSTADPKEYALFEKENYPKVAYSQ